MPREYQPKRSNPYYIGDRNLYMQLVYMIKGYPVLKQRRIELLYGSSAPPDGQPKGTKPGNPTEQKAIVLSAIDSQLAAIDGVIFELNNKYAKTYTGEPFDAYEAFLDYSVFCYYRSSTKKDIAPSERTWKNYRSEFAYRLAKKLNYF